MCAGFDGYLKAHREARNGGGEGGVSRGLQLIFAPGPCTVLLQLCECLEISFTGATSC